MEYVVNVDKQGRMVIPASLRKLLGISKGGKATIRYRNGRLELMPINVDLKRRVEKWVEVAVKTNPKPFSEEIEESWKWIDRKYAERKLGIR
ncbi:MAG: division/cell wall cluster transcriptional repressor MraZ [archaeon GB-1867-097]|nr:division/cell wall cluster transcriptional repressor MraZ [Candidatus Culexmicrobium thermophilum]